MSPLWCYFFLVYYSLSLLRDLAITSLSITASVPISTILFPIICYTNYICIPHLYCHGRHFKDLVFFWFFNQSHRFCCWHSSTRHTITPIQSLYIVPLPPFVSVPDLIESICLSLLLLHFSPLIEKKPETILTAKNDLYPCPSPVRHHTQSSQDLLDAFFFIFQPVLVLVSNIARS